MGGMGESRGAVEARYVRKRLLSVVKECEGRAVDVGGGRASLGWGPGIGGQSVWNGWEQGGVNGPTQRDTPLYGPSLLSDLCLAGRPKEV